MLRMVGVEVEGVKRLRLVPAGTRGELNTLDDVRDARGDSGLDNLAARAVERDLRDVPLRVDRPLDDRDRLRCRDGPAAPCRSKRAPRRDGPPRSPECRPGCDRLRARGPGYGEPRHRSMQKTRGSRSRRVGGSAESMHRAGRPSSCSDRPMRTARWAPQRRLPPRTRDRRSWHPPWRRLRHRSPAPTRRQTRQSRGLLWKDGSFGRFSWATTLPQVERSTQQGRRASLGWPCSPRREIAIRSAARRTPRASAPTSCSSSSPSGGMATVYLAARPTGRAGPAARRDQAPAPAPRGDKTSSRCWSTRRASPRPSSTTTSCKVRELGFDGGVPFIVMDYVEGASLAELRRELAAAGRAIDVRVAACASSLDMLSAAPRRARATRRNGAPAATSSIATSRPTTCSSGATGARYITDFGIAKAEDRIQTTRTHEVKGKLAYLAPERIDKRRICTVQSDVFSMAVVLWECFAGRRLFRGEEAVDILQEVMSAPIPRSSRSGAHIPRALDDVIARALSRDLETRYATADAFARGIGDAAGAEALAVRTTSPGSSTRSSARASRHSKSAWERSISGAHASVIPLPRRSPRWLGAARRTRRGDRPRRSLHVGRCAALERRLGPRSLRRGRSTRIGSCRRDAFSPRSDDPRRRHSGPHGHPGRPERRRKRRDASSRAPFSARSARRGSAGGRDAARRIYEAEIDPPRAELRRRPRTISSRPSGTAPTP